MSHIYQHVWPIIDGTLSRQDLIAEAVGELEAVVDAMDAIAVGPPLWLVHPGAAVMGWTAWPGDVLIARVPVEVAGVCDDWWSHPPGVDRARVERAVAGDLSAQELTTAERRHVVVRLIDAGLDDRAIGMLLRWSDTPLRARNAVARFRSRHHIIRPAATTEGTRAA